MAEGNPSVVANHILRLLRSEGIKKINVPQELLAEVESNISALLGVILEAEKKNGRDVRLKNWLIRVEDVLNDADNLLEEGLCTVASSRRLKGNTAQPSLVVKFFSPTNYLFSRSKTTRAIDQINKRLGVIREDAGVSNLEERSDSFQRLQWRETHSFLDESVLVSREDDKRKIISILFNPEFERDVSVLPIVGMGGIGKTTLAQAVFNDEKVKGHFQERIWVLVGQDFDAERIFRRMVECVMYEKTGYLEKEALRDFLGEKMGEKRCLVVLDDVWNEDRLQWHSFIRMLPDGMKQFNIIVTTRSKKVASIAGTVPPYILDGIDLEGSWNLFKRMAFDGEEPKYSYQTEIGMKLVARCQGVPLAIKTMASMLRFRDSELDWKHLYENEFSIGESDGDAMLQTLQLSYNNLPSHLRHCFAYCSLFPKDYEFDVQTMIKLWMAQGFIQPQAGEQSLEDVGYQCFFELLRGSFFQECERDLTGHIAKFRIHDLMHDLAIVVAGKRCATLSSYTDTVDERVSHVSIAAGNLFSEEQIPHSLIHAKKIRSILMPSPLLLEDRSGRADKICKSIISRFLFLRTLDMHALGIKVVPNSIGKLILLKYLDLSENGDITELPNSITKLANLQTLRLSSCFNLKTLPRDIANLVNLKHLETDGCYSLVSRPDLETLAQLVVSEGESSHSNEPKKVEAPNKLREFEEKILKHGDDATSNLNEVQDVQSLSLEWESGERESVNDEPLDSNLLLRLRELTLIGFRGETLFDPCFPSNLIRLCLSRWEKGNNLVPLEQCSNLKELVLHKIEHLEYIFNGVEIESASTTPTPFFPFLEALHLIELPNLRGWWKVQVNSEDLPSFPHLSKLVLEACPKLASLPLFPTLEEELVLDSTCVQPLLDTMKHGAKHAASSSTSEQSSPLSELKNLSIVDIEKFNNSEANKIQWNTLKSLQKLKFDFLPEMTTLSEGLQHLESLEELDVWRCGVMELPHWIGKLKALKKLVIRVCPKLGSLPQELCETKELTLEIEGCPKLIRRCEKEIGADWDKIKHLERDLRLGQISST